MLMNDIICTLSLCKFVIYTKFVHELRHL